jgi:hypothetical protein
VRREVCLMLCMKSVHYVAAEDGICFGCNKLEGGS